MRGMRDSTHDPTVNLSVVSEPYSQNRKFSIRFIVTPVTKVPGVCPCRFNIFQTQTGDWL